MTTPIALCSPCSRQRAGRVLALMLIVGASFPWSQTARADVSGKVVTLHEFSPPYPESALVRASDGSFYGTTYYGGNGFGSIYKITTGGAVTTLYGFHKSDGANPVAGLVQTSDGSFYGTTYAGGASGLGTVFRLTSAGVFSVLHSFSGGSGGANPRCVLLRASDGSFYGTTSDETTATSGTVFRIDSTGTLTTIYHFDGTHGANPESGLIVGADGAFYGTAPYGGTNFEGVAYRITTAGAETVLYNFGSADGTNPAGRLVLGKDGNFYGTAYAGAGPDDNGSVYMITSSGSLTQLHNFNGDDGSAPVAELVQGSDGNFYGTTRDGGDFGFGTVFQVTPAGSFMSLASFAGGSEGGLPYAGLVSDGTGLFYGTTRGVHPTSMDDSFGTVFRISTPGTLAVLHHFYYDGENPVEDALTLGRDGNIYGATTLGGDFDTGTLFRITAAGEFTGLHSFEGVTGYLPTSNPIQGEDGNFYGTATDGGTKGLGALYQLTAGGTYNVLYNLSFAGHDGQYPGTGLIQGSDGNFYGVTEEGGSFGMGAVFKFSASTYSVVQYFSPYNSAGSLPNTSLFLGADGTLYGATSAGSTNSLGGVYSLTSDTGFVLLHAFDSPTGTYAAGGLVQSGDGFFYGATTGGGDYGKGTVYRLNTANEFTVIHSFQNLDGVNPALGRLVPAGDGSFYGVTTGGGAHGTGTIYKIGPDGTVTTLYSFDGTNGASPLGGIVQAADGSFYGTTSGGATNFGTVYHFTLAPAISSARNATAYMGKAFSYQITATNKPTSYGAANLPPGLSINQSTGKISGTPTKTGTYTPTIAAFNGGGSGSTKLTLMVNAGSPAITSALSASGQVGKAFSYQITATNSPATYGESGLPAGLTIVQSTGKISGTPKQAGTYMVTIAAFNAAGSGSAKLTLTIKVASPVITSALSATGQVGKAFSYQIAATNSPTSFGESGLPAGLTINQSTGKLSGTPTKAGTYTVTIAAFNAGGSGSAKLTLTVKPSA